MKKLTFILISLLIIKVVHSQVKHDFVWIMGDDGYAANPSSPDYYEIGGVNIFDFNEGEFVINRDFRDTDFFLTNASVCDSGGDLFFYTNGCSVFRPDGELMENGAGLNPGVAYSSGNCPQNGNPVHQGALILPVADNDSLFFLFHKAFVLGDGPPFLVYPGELHITTINMKANNGEGSVVSKNNLILEDTLNEDLQAVRHPNGVDWWVFTSSLKDNLYYRILVTEDGVMGISGQAIGPKPDPLVGAKSVFSPDGQHFARYDRTNQLLLYDFDRETGLLGNLLKLDADTTEDGRDGSVAFSSSGRFLYVNSTLRVYQFDLEESDVQSSRVLLGEYDGFKYKDIFPATFGLMQLAPDCKIYFPTRSSTPFYHVIQYPDRKGLACGFQQRGLPLIATNIASIPNFPNYRLGTGFPVCDSTIQLVVHSVPVLPPRAEVLVYPNPASNYVTIELPQALASGAEWSLYNGVGQAGRFATNGKGSDEGGGGVGRCAAGVVFLGN